MRAVRRILRLIRLLSVWLGVRSRPLLRSARTFAVSGCTLSTASWYRGHCAGVIGWGRCIPAVAVAGGWQCLNGRSATTSGRKASRPAVPISATRQSCHASSQQSPGDLRERPSRARSDVLCSCAGAALPCDPVPVCRCGRHECIGGNAVKLSSVLFVVCSVSCVACLLC